MKIQLEPKPTDLLIVDIFVHVIILLSILLIFFVYIIAPLETKELTQQIKSQIDTNIPILLEKGGPGLHTALVGIDKSQVFDTMIDYYDRPDEANVYRNRTPILSAIIVLISLSMGFLAIWAVLKVSCRKRIPVGQILLENILLFGFIGIIEYVFFQEIATKYIPTKPSFLIDQTLQSLKDKFSKSVKSESLR
jgi:hypothetical protein